MSTLAAGPAAGVATVAGACFISAIVYDGTGGQAMMDPMLDPARSLRILRYCFVFFAALACFGVVTLVVGLNGTSAELGDRITNALFVILGIAGLVCAIVPIPGMVKRRSRYRNALNGT